MCTDKKHRRYGDFDITLNTGSEIIEPISSEKLLGGFISHDLKWNNHIKDNEKSMFKRLTSRINALGKMAKVAPFKTRKMLANGMVMSSLIYLIQVWGGSSLFLIKILQVLQNRAARIVTKSGWLTSTKSLLDQCGWLSVKQLVEYHSLLLVYKIKSEGKPAYLFTKLSQPFTSSTRFSAGNISENKIKETRNDNELHKSSFIPRTISSWNSIPSNVRLSPDLKTFKVRVKVWIRNNIDLK